MELKRFVVLAFVIALLTVGAVLLALPKGPQLPAGARTVPYVFSVGADPGFDLETDIFRLGQVPPGGKGQRSLTIEPSITSVRQDSMNASVDRARVYAMGDGASWISVEPSVVGLPGTVTVSVAIPRSAEMRQYRGVLVVVPVMD